MKCFYRFLTLLLCAAMMACGGGNSGGGGSSSSGPLPGVIGDCGVAEKGSQQLLFVLPSLRRTAEILRFALDRPIQGFAQNDSDRALQ